MYKMVYVKRKGMRSKRTYRRKSTTKSRKGLSKTERSQVKKIAKKTVNSLAESKYFSTSGAITSLAPSPIWRTGNGTSDFISEITCYGFTTGWNRFKTPTMNAPYTYGVNNVTGTPNSMEPLNLNRIFTTSDAAVERRQYAVEGHSVRPSYAECKWLLERPQSNTQTNPEAGVPYVVRMIRVRPKALKGSFLPQDPYKDLFLDQYNEAFGVGTNNLSANVVFDKQDFYMAKVNNRLYTLLEDKMITMLPTSTTSNIGNTVEANVVTQPSSSGNKCFSTKHNIGKELFYNEPNTFTSANDDRQYPDTGFQNEFVLFHIIGQGTQPLGAGVEGDVGSAFGITLSARPVSTFKDI